MSANGTVTPFPARTIGPEGLDQAHLQRLAELLAETEPPEPLLVQLRIVEPEIEIGLIPAFELDPDAGHLADLLIGFEAPESWWGIGVVTGGRAWPQGPGAPIDAPTRVFVCHLVARTGIAATAVSGLDLDGEVPVGRVPDLLRRSMHLPMPPALGGPGDLLDAKWLDHCLECAAGHHGRVTWRRIVDLHPLAVPVRDPMALRGLTAEVQANGWDRLLRLDPVAIARILQFDDPDEIGWRLIDWVDAGTIGSWLLATLPPIDEMLEGLDALLPPGLMRKVRATLLTPPTSAEHT